MNTRVEPLRAGLAILTAVAMVAAMMLLFGSDPALGQASDPDTECADARGYNDEWWKIQINDNGTTGSIETSDNVDNDDIDFDLDSSGSPWTYSWTNQSSDGFAVVRVVEKEGHGGDVHNGVWLVGEGFSDEELEGDISHITFCFGTPPATTTTTTVAETTTTTVADTTTTTVADTTTTTVADTTTTTVADTTTTTIPDDVLGTVITTSTTAPVVAVTTTIPDEVLDTAVEAEELPFTGIDSDQLVGMAVLLLAGGLVLLGVTGKREDA